MAQSYLAIDLGSESGRAVVGRFDGARLALEELHRFPNGPVRVLDSLHWDVLRLWSEIQAVLALAARSCGGELAGIGLCTWGVDFALLDRAGALIGNPYHYRDRRTDGMVEEACRRVPREEIYRQTGTELLQVNTLYQLLAMALQRAPQLELADRLLLLLPDLFNYWLTGRAVCELTEATTSQCYDLRAGAWARGLLRRLGLRDDLLGEVVPPGTILGPLLPAVAAQAGLATATAIAPACHDTQSAVAAVPATGDDFAYISSGTWSLVGIETVAPIITAESLAANVTNEAGVEGRYCVLKNVVGLWLLQECRRAWAQRGERWSYAELTALAEQAPPFGPLVDPSDPAFLPPGDMPARIQAACRRTGQAVPETPAEIVRCVLESLALKYRWVLERLEELAGRRLATIHVVGGGAQNTLLCQLTADACARPVLAGPVEATAVGNLLVQARARGELGSLAELRQVVRASFRLASYDPHPSERWEAHYARFLALV